MTMPLETLWGRLNGAVGDLSRIDPRRWRGFAHVETAFSPRGHLSIGRREVAGEKDIVFYIELQRGPRGWNLSADLSRGDGHVLAETAWHLPGTGSAVIDGDAPDAEPMLALSTGGGFGAPGSFTFADEDL
ncbi:hypothetical protein [Fodinicola feengrottensis]|uniref:Htaa domain-containing protein n=1 Tax=Fodinicola feengrottensis TaxID=435914 RepID=A0ABP4U8M7_9ACTN|nr:hypothetical protein [Fodinicola feengrottensis]